MKIQVEIDLAGHYSPEPVEEVIADRAARQAVKLGGESLQELVRSRVQRALDDALPGLIEPAVLEALETSIQLTNDWGEAKGEPIALKRYIAAKVEAALKRTSGHSNSRTLIDSVISNALDRRFRREMEAAAKAARDAVTKAIREHGAKVLADLAEKLPR